LIIILAEHLWCAKCYFARDDLFVMQNIEDLGYVSLPSGTRFLIEDQMRPIFKALATLHASSVAYERSHRVTIGVQFRKWLDEKSIDADIPWWTTGVKVSIEFFLDIPYLNPFLYSFSLPLISPLDRRFWLRLQLIP